MLNSSFLGNIEDDRKDGIAEFIVDKFTFKLRLDSFTDYQKVTEMIQLAYNMGERNARAGIKMKLLEIL